MEACIVSALLRIAPATLASLLLLPGLCHAGKVYVGHYYSGSDMSHVFPVAILDLATGRYSEARREVGNYDYFYSLFPDQAKEFGLYHRGQRVGAFVAENKVMREVDHTISKYEAHEGTSTVPDDVPGCCLALSPPSSWTAKPVLVSLSEMRRLRSELTQLAQLQLKADGLPQHLLPKIKIEQFNMAFLTKDVEKPHLIGTFTGPTITGPGDVYNDVLFIIAAWSNEKKKYWIMLANHYVIGYDGCYEYESHEDCSEWFRDFMDFDNDGIAEVTTAITDFGFDCTGIYSWRNGRFRRVFRGACGPPTYESTQSEEADEPMQSEKPDESSGRLQVVGASACIDCILGDNCWVWAKLRVRNTGPPVSSQVRLSYDTGVGVFHDHAYSNVTLARGEERIYTFEYERRLNLDSWGPQSLYRLEFVPFVDGKEAGTFTVTAAFCRVDGDVVYIPDP